MIFQWLSLVLLLLFVARLKVLQASSRWTFLVGGEKEKVKNERLRGYEISLEWDASRDPEAECSIYIAAHRPYVQHDVGLHNRSVDMALARQFAQEEVEGWKQASKKWYVAARHNGKLVGYALFVDPRDIDPAYTVPADEVRQLYVASMIVAPDYQGAGVGTELLQAPLKYIPLVKSFILVAHSGVQSFYERLGFVRCDYSNPDFGAEWHGYKLVLSPQNIEGRHDLYFPHAHNQLLQQQR